MQVIVKYGNSTKEFNDKPTITIGSTEVSDFVVRELGDSVLKLVYSSKYNNYVLVNSSNNKDILFNNKSFSKVLVTPKFTISLSSIQTPIEVVLKAKVPVGTVQEGNSMISANSVQAGKDVFDSDIEKHRIAIIKEIGHKISELKNGLKSSNRLTIFLYFSMVVLSVVSAFGITNYLFGFKIDNSSSVLNLSTNPVILACISVMIAAVSFAMKSGVFSFLDINKNKRLGDTDIMQRVVIMICSVFMLVVYVLNLLYYKSIPGFFATSLFISLLFVGSLAAVTVSIGYLEFQMKNDRQILTTCEYREDFESVMKDYRRLIGTYVNNLSANRINTVKSNLLNNQIKAFVEICVGMITAPILAYGVSNTLASCFPEAASWIRISGIRFSPVFLVLATCLIIFAFFSFVRAFVIGKQIMGSEIIKFDGFHDYNSHGVTVLGIDAMRNLEREKAIVMSIACVIVLIEFTMNLTFFIAERGSDLQQMFVCVVAALVATALLVAETVLLSGSMYKIHNYSDLLSTLD